MTEIEYVLHIFDSRFGSFADRRIILHGTRTYAEELIRRFGTRYRFCAVMTNDEPRGETFCGLPVITPSLLPSVSADLMILTERVRHEYEAFKTVRDQCAALGIRILDMYGTDTAKAEREYRDIRPRTEEEHRGLIRDHDAVIFEVMDTLLQTDGADPQPDSLAESLFRFAVENGKSVYFSLRKSFSENTQIRILKEHCMIRDENDPALIRRSGEDLGLRAVLEKHPGKKFMYYGTGFANEFLLPRYYGIDSFRIRPLYRYDYKASLSRILESGSSMTEFASGSFEDTAALLEQYDVISFDIYDTLITRKTLLPEDVFELIGQRLEKTGLKEKAKDFPEKRREMLREFPESDINRQYKALQSRPGFSAEECRRLLDMELRTEKELTVSRHRTADLLELAVKSGKTVVLTSDMYLTGKMLEDILTGLGLSGWQEILVSCEQHRTKSSGLFEVLKQHYPGKKIIHFGNDITADIVATTEAGIRAVRLPSGTDLAIQGGWGELLKYADTADERNLLGLIISRVFNDPFLPAGFSASERKGRLTRFAVGACMPVITGYLFWLAEMLQNDHYDRVLFLSRDGFMLTALFNEIRGRCGYELPGADYFYSNRHSAFLLCADNRTFHPAAEAFFDIRPAAEVFRNMFGWAPSDPNEPVGKLFEENLPAIRETVREQKENFRKYLAHQGIRSGGKYAVMDFVSSGKTLDFLRAGTGLDLTGFFTARPLYETVHRTDICYYLDGNSSEQDFFRNYYLEMESVMTSPESALDRFDEQGRPVFAEEIRTGAELAEIGFIQDRITEAAADFIRHFGHDGLRIRPDFAAKMYAADGLHGILRRAYDDWGKFELI